jgi:hypothetical protein
MNPCRRLSRPGIPGRSELNGHSHAPTPAGSVAPANAYPPLVLPRPSIREPGRARDTLAGGAVAPAPAGDAPAPPSPGTPVT